MSAKEEVVVCKPQDRTEMIKLKWFGHRMRMLEEDPD